MKIVVDHNRCAGNAVCAQEAPELFRVDDDGELNVLQSKPGDERRGDAERAAYMCPTRALKIEP
jgi:ferredoxin